MSTNPNFTNERLLVEQHRIRLKQAWEQWPHTPICPDHYCPAHICGCRNPLLEARRRGRDGR